MKKYIPLLIAALTACTPEIYADRHLHNNEKEFSDVSSPTVPESIVFCDQKIDLDRTDMYERLDRELTAMAYTHGTTMLVLKRANRYFPILAPILKENGVPSDLIYLACIESSLNPTAVSPAKAAGLWQFMPATAREFGLEVNDDIDERYHPEKATAAACRYLKNAYRRFGNWESVAASYNAGQGRIFGELEKQQQESAFDLFLNSETARYIFRMMAMKAIMENPREFGYNLSAEDLYQPYTYHEVTVDTPVDDWVSWAASNGISYMQLREHNPWIRSRSLPNKTGKTYTVKIPDEKSMSRSRHSVKVYNPDWINNH